LVASGSFVGAILTSTHDISIRKEAAIVDGIDLACHSLLEKAVLIELVVKVLGDLVVLRGVRSTEGIKRKSEPFSELLLDSMHLRAILRDREPGLVGGEFCRSAVLIRRTNEQDLLSASPLETSIGIGRKHRADEIAQVLYTVDVG
jgi:hypothetical protein